MLEYAIMGGILFGLYFTLVGIGMNLIFGVMRIVNLAHGDFIMLGALGASLVYAAYTLSPILAAIIALFVFVIIGLPLYYMLIPRLLKSPDPEMLSLILFFGFSEVIESITTIIAGPTERSIPGTALGAHPVNIFGQVFPVAWVISAAAAVVAVAFVYVYLYRTRIGLLTRAVMAHREEALATGISANKVSALAFGIGIGLAAAAGAFTPFMIGGVTPDSGVNLTITSFTVIIVGSLGSPLGTVLGGLIYGISLMIMQTYLSSWASLLPFVMLIVILLIRPSGLLGRKVRHA